MKRSLASPSKAMSQLVGPERKTAGIGHLETSLQVSAQLALEVGHQIESRIGQQVLRRAVNTPLGRRGKQLLPFFEIFFAQELNR